MESWISDGRRALRSLVRTPGPMVAAVAALGLGIGAATAIFSVADAVFLRPLPYAHSARLITFEGEFRVLGMRNLGASAPEYVDYLDRTRSFEGMAAFARFDANLTGTGDPERLAGLRVTPDLLPLLGAAPAIGRSFAPAETEPGHDAVAVVSWGLWQRRLGADPAAVGRRIVLDGRAYTVAGVAPRDFAFPPSSARFGGAADVFVPLALDAAEREDRSRYGLAVVARRRSDVSPGAAESEVATLARAMEQEHPRSYRGPGGEPGGWGVRVVPLHEAVAGDARATVSLLFAAALLLLLVACADVAHLLLALGLARRQALAVRLALGASRGRVVREVLLESLAIALAGGVLGIVLALGGTRLLLSTATGIPRVAGAAIDGRALAVALGLSLLTAVVFGLAPVLQALGPRLADALKVGDRSGTVGRLGTRARRGLVVSELALAVLLLAGSGLLLRSFLRLRAVPPGFATQGVLSLEIALSPARYGEPARRQAALDRMAGELRRLPGVEATAMVSRLPLTGPALGGPFSIEGRPFDPTAGTPPFAVYRAASPDYHAALGVSIARGRELSSADRPESSRVVVINRALERAFFPREDPLGHRVKLGAPGSPRPWLTIVGVAADVRDHALSLPSPPELTVPLAQDPPASAVVLVRTAGDPLALAAPARKAILAADPEQPVTRVRTLRQIVDESIAERRTPAVVLAAFALVAMTLAALGTYGVMSYTVSRRTREIGLRMALGARPADVGRLVVGEGLGLAAAGLALGFAGALAFGRTLASLLFEVPPADPVTFAGVALLLALVTAAASARPARRAAMVEPAVALRRE